MYTQLRPKHLKQMLSAARADERKKLETEMMICSDKSEVALDKEFWGKVVAGFAKQYSKILTDEKQVNPQALLEGAYRAELTFYARQHTVKEIFADLDNFFQHSIFLEGRRKMTGEHCTHLYDFKDYQKLKQKYLGD